MQMNVHSSKILMDFHSALSVTGSPGRYRCNGQGPCYCRSGSLQRGAGTVLLARGQPDACAWLPKRSLQGACALAGKLHLRCFLGMGGAGGSDRDCALQAVSQSASGSVVTEDVFDCCDGAVDTFFANPFVLGTDPCLWRELQAAVEAELAARAPVPGAARASASAAASYQDVTEADMEDALLALGLRAAASATVWLTAAQKRAVEGLMAELEDTLAFEVVAWQLADALARADRANRRGPQQ
jgi:hypothetical protein